MAIRKIVQRNIEKWSCNRDKRSRVVLGSGTGLMEKHGSVWHAGLENPLNPASRVQQVMSAGVWRLNERRTTEAWFMGLQRGAGASEDRGWSRSCHILVFCPCLQSPNLVGFKGSVSPSGLCLHSEKRTGKPTSRPGCTSTSPILPVEPTSDKVHRVFRVPQAGDQA